MLMAIFTIQPRHDDSLAQIVAASSGQHLLLRPSFAFAVLAFVLIALAGIGRIRSTTRRPTLEADDDPRGDDPRSTPAGTWP
jgi:hypothetical protein